MLDVASITAPASTAMIVAALDAKIAHPVTKGAASKKMPNIMRITRSTVPIFAVISMPPFELSFKLRLWAPSDGDIVTK